MNKESQISLHTGSMMPVMGLGTWELLNDTAGTVAYALEKGYRMIDTSSDYGTHEGIGHAIKTSSVDRDEIFIITKVEETDDAYAATKEYLDQLGLDYVNLMLIHRPPPTGAGEDLWEGLIRAQEEGLTVDIGVSNYPITDIETLIDASGQVPAVNQIEWNPFGYSREMMKYCEEREIVIQAYSPLTRAKRLNDETLMQLGQKYGKSAAQILIRWNLQMGTIPIPKANQKPHLDENINVFNFQIEDEDIALMNSRNERYSALGGLPYI